MTEVIDADLDQALKVSVLQSRSILIQDLVKTRAVLGNLYTGDDQARYFDRLSALVPGADGFGVDALRKRAFQFTTKNTKIASSLLFSKTSSLLGPLFPSVPALEADPVTDGAYEFAKDQTWIWRTILSQGTYKAAMWKAIMAALFDQYAGIYCGIDMSQDKILRFYFEYVDPYACGWEPHGRRYVWRTHVEQAHDLRDAEKAALEGHEINPWTLVHVTDVYLDNFGGEERKKATYVRVTDQKPTKQDPATTSFDFGAIASYTEYDGPPPIKFLPLTMPGTREDVPVSEVAHFLPALNTVAVAWDKIQTTIAELNTTIVVDNRYVDLDKMADVDIGGGMKKVIPAFGKKADADGFGEGDTGAAQKARPLEYQPILDDCIQGYSVALGQFNQIVGGDMQSGSFPEKVHPATTAALTAQGQDDRNRTRHERIIDVTKEVGEFIGWHQRAVLGDTVELKVAGEGQTSVLKDRPVPNWKTTRYVMRAVASDLANAKHASNPDAIQADMLNARAAAELRIPGALAWFLDSANRYRRAIGLMDGDITIPRPPTDDDPMAAINHAQRKQIPLVAVPGQDHAAHMAVIQSEILKEEALGARKDEEYIDFLTGGLLSHQALQLSASPVDESRIANNSRANGSAQELLTP